MAILSANLLVRSIIHDPLGLEEDQSIKNPIISHRHFKSPTQQAPAAFAGSQGITTCNSTRWQPHLSTESVFPTGWVSQAGIHSPSPRSQRDALF